MRDKLLAGDSRTRLSQAAASRNRSNDTLFPLVSETFRRVSGVAGGTLSDREVELIITRYASAAAEVRLFEVAVGRSES